MMTLSFIHSVSPSNIHIKGTVNPSSLWNPLFFKEKEGRGFHGKESSPLDEIRELG